MTREEAIKEINRKQEEMRVLFSQITALASEHGIGVHLDFGVYGSGMFWDSSEGWVSSSYSC